MGNNNSPLESLAAFAISFAAGAISVVALGIYNNWVKSKIVEKNA